MASTLAEMAHMALARDFHHIDLRYTQILLYEAAPRVLHSYPEVLSDKAQRHLEKLGVKVYTNTRVTNVDAGGITANGQRVPASTVLWSAGVLASPAGHWLNAAVDKSGSITVNSDLSIPGHPEIFAIGDTAHVVAHSHNLVGIKSREPMLMPGVAQPAIQEGRYVARVIRTRVAGTLLVFWHDVLTIMKGCLELASFDCGQFDRSIAFLDLLFEIGCAPFSATTW